MSIYLTPKTKYLILKGVQKHRTTVGCFMTGGSGLPEKAAGAPGNVFRDLPRPHICG